MSRVVSPNMASHCAPSSHSSADSTTLRTITRFRGSGCEELTSPSRILSMVAGRGGPGAAAARPLRLGPAPPAPPRPAPPRPAPPASAPPRSRGRFQWSRAAPPASPGSRVGSRGRRARVLRPPRCARSADSGARRCRSSGSGRRASGEGRRRSAGGRSGAGGPGGPGDAARRCARGSLGLGPLGRVGPRSRCPGGRATGAGGGRSGLPPRLGAPRSLPARLPGRPRRLLPPPS
uniref:Uncharacterized protein n=1 Tax=Canis lupus familiaris TaxID=9615 RepID=A0A8C0MI82_CANLF